MGELKNIFQNMSGFFKLLPREIHFKGSHRSVQESRVYKNYIKVFEVVFKNHIRVQDPKLIHYTLLIQDRDISPTEFHKVLQERENNGNLRPI